MAYIGTSPSNGVRRRFVYVATSNQTSFSGNDENGISLVYVDVAYLDVYQNGVKLKSVSDYASTTGTSVVLVQGASADDVVEIIAFDVFSIGDTVSAGSGGSFGGAIASSGTVTATGGLIIGNGTNIGTVGDTDAISIASNGVVTFSQTPVGDNAGTVVQVKNVSKRVVQVVTTTMPYDDTIPQKTEGEEIFSLAITPTSSSNKLHIHIFGMVCATGVTHAILALFQDGTANALAAHGGLESNASEPHSMSFVHVMAAGTTSETTFKVRLGSETGNSVLNGQGNGPQRFGGVATSGMIITEMKV